MKPERLESIERISRTSLELDPEERDSYIEEACSGDEELKSAVETRVAQYRRAKQYFAGLAERIGLEGLGDPKFTVIEGQTFGKYKIEHQVGRGGMGIVYRAIDTELDRPVALKFLSPRFADDEKAQIRFSREARIAASLDHPNILKVHEVLEYQGLAVLVMEFIEGETLRDQLKQGPLSVNEWFDYAAQLADGLEAAHEAGIVHRDLKPANIMISNEGVVKILDFGLAKLREASALTRTGATLGTVAYMSPEQARGEEVDHRTDIWSLGVMLYEMLCGELPFKGDYDQALIYSILNHDPDPSEASSEEVPEHVPRVVRKALSKSAEQRFQRASDLKSALSDPSMTYDSPLFESKGLRGSTAFRLAGAGLVVLLIGFFWYRNARQTIQLPALRSIAVMPFDSHSPNPADSNLAGGLTVALTNQLARIGDIKVIAPSTALRYLGIQKTPQEIRNELGVDGLLKADLFVTDEDIQIEMHLVETDSGSIIWANRLTESKENLPIITNNLALAVAGALGFPSDLVDSSDLHQTTSLEAYRAFLECNFYWEMAGRTFKDPPYYSPKVDSAITLALELDSTYADALGLKAILAINNSLGLGRINPEVYELVSKSLALDPENRYGLIALAKHVNFAEWDWDNAESIYLHLLEAAPNDMRARWNLATLYQNTNRDSLAIVHINTAHELAPLSVPLTYGRMYTLNKAGKYNDVIRIARRLIAFDSTTSIAYAYLGKAAFLSGRDSLAIASYDRFRALENTVGVMMAINYRDLGFEDIFEEMVTQVKESKNSWILTYLYYCLGEKENTLYWMEKEIAKNPFFLATLMTLDAEKLLKDEPRFRVVLRKGNLEQFVYGREMTAAVDMIPPGP